MGQTPLLAEAMRFMLQFRKTAHHGLALATRDCQPCHFSMLERLHCAIAQHGTNGAICVSEIAAQMRAAPSAISRSLRQLENEGFILRTTDPGDRRKIWVQLTPAGNTARQSCEDAVNAYLQRVFDRLGEDNVRRMLADWQCMEQALAAETLAGTAPPTTPAPPPAPKKEQK
ncbi:MAG: MarR family transcriptional regulator [Gemmiger sp.]|nr:MarR family transcriptional regulator [Gemmiger sp.]